MPQGVREAGSKSTQGAWGLRGEAKFVGRVRQVGASRVETVQRLQIRI